MRLFWFYKPYYDKEYKDKLTYKHMDLEYTANHRYRILDDGPLYALTLGELEKLVKEGEVNREKIREKLSDSTPTQEEMEMVLTYTASQRYSTPEQDPEWARKKRELRRILREPRPDLEKEKIKGIKIQRPSGNAIGWRSD